MKAEKQEFDFADEDYYREEFMKEKYEDYEKELPENDNMQDKKGWGSWTGYGVQEQQRDIQRKQKLQQEKEKKIEEIKARRKDGKLDNVIVNPKRVKAIKKYLVEKLPHGYDNKEQFNFEVTRQIGREWNPQTLFRNQIKEKVVCTPGEVIRPMNKKVAPKTKYL